jgi:hypothetical protein
MSKVKSKVKTCHRPQDMTAFSCENAMDLRFKQRQKSKVGSPKSKFIKCLMWLIAQYVFRGIFMFMKVESLEVGSRES